jgi:hypothetical protein
MWCIGRITVEYRERMYDQLALYAKPYDPSEPVVCLDEKKQATAGINSSPVWSNQSNGSIFKQLRTARIACGRVRWFNFSR